MEWYPRVPTHLAALCLKSAAKKRLFFRNGKVQKHHHSILPANQNMFIACLNTFPSVFPKRNILVGTDNKSQIVSVPQHSTYELIAAALLILVRGYSVRTTHSCSAHVTLQFLMSPVIRAARELCYVRNMSSPAGSSSQAHQLNWLQQPACETCGGSAVFLAFSIAADSQKTAQTPQGPKTNGPLCTSDELTALWHA